MSMDGGEATGRRIPSRLRDYPIIAVTLLTLGSGILNVYSVIGRALPERVEWLRRFFPLEFVHLSRSATLLTGFALIVSSLNVFKRKRRAFWLTGALAAFSVVFHLAKGIDYEEALLSLALLAVLFVTRRRFTVRSRQTDWRSAAQRVLIAGAVLMAYGIAGFWFLEKREFGIDFNWKQSIELTVDYLALQGNPLLQPRTRFAEWFLDSLSLLGAVVIVYSLIAAFRPVVYQLRTHPHEIDRAREILERNGRTSQDYFKARPDKSFFYSLDGENFVAYRVGGNFAVALGDPAGPAQGIEPIVRKFSEYCRDNGWGLAFHQATGEFLGMYRRLGFKKLKVGDEAIVDLTRFTLEGKAAKTTRSRVHQLEVSGIRTRYVEPPIPDELMDQIRSVSDEWLQIPGRRERRFSLGMFDEEYVQSTAVMTVEDSAGNVLAFLNVVPTYKRGETTIDLMRRRSEAPNGVMDYLFVKMFQKSKELGFERFNLGMAPMSGFQGKEEATPEERAIHSFFQHLNFLFSFKGLLAYKAKFASSWEPRYLIYRNILDLPRVALAISAVTEIRDE